MIKHTQETDSRITQIIYNPTEIFVTFESDLNQK